MVGTAVWSAFLTFTVISCWTPGPNTLLCAAHGARHGWRESMPLVGGMWLGFTTLHLTVGMGLTALERWAWVFDILAWVGVAYILWLAWHFARSHPDPEAEGPDAEHRLGIRTGATLQLVNGKAWVHMLILFGTFAPQFGGGPYSVVLITAFSSGIGVCSVIAWAGLGSTLQGVMAHPRHGRVLNLGFALALVVLAIWIALS